MRCYPKALKPIDLAARLSHYLEVVVFKDICTQKLHNNILTHMVANIHTSQCIPTLRYCWLVMHSNAVLNIFVDDICTSLINYIETHNEAFGKINKFKSTKQAGRLLWTNILFIIQLQDNSHLCYAHEQYFNTWEKFCSRFVRNMLREVKLI